MKQEPIIVLWLWLLMGGCCAAPQPSKVSGREAMESSLPCTRDQKKSYQQLLSKGCDCLDPFVREVVGSIDPCFSDGCGCICSRLGELSQCGPPI